MIRKMNLYAICVSQTHLQGLNTITILLQLLCTIDIVLHFLSRETAVNLSSINYHANLGIRLHHYINITIKVLTNVLTYTLQQNEEENSKIN